jgi:iron complex transport system ATP-binding protein
MKLEVSNAEFHYDVARTSGFKNINFSLEDGEVMSILGPNGCGKTTLLKCLSCLIKLGKGGIAVDNRDISRLPRAEIASYIGYVPQLHQLAFPFSVLDTVLAGRAPHLGLLESPGLEDATIAEEALETMGIYHLRDKPYTQLSGGERQLVIFARVLAQQPSLLLLDEPTSHLDFGNQIRLLRIVENLAATGLPIIMTSHFPDHAFLVSSKVALMKQGEFIDMGTPNGVITESNLEKVYNIKVKVVNVDSGVNRKVCVPVGDCDPATDSRNIIHSGGNMSDFDVYLKKAGDFHGHVCAGIALGTRISLAAMRALGMKPGVKNKSLIVYTETDRCMTDAVQVITGCSLGHRSLKHVDYGKFAATFVNLDTGKAVRATVKEHFGSEDTIEETLKKLARIPDSELVTLQEVTVNIPETDLPGPPKNRAVCSSCGERIMDGRQVSEGNKTLCRACAHGKYYSERTR